MSKEKISHKCTVIYLLIIIYKIAMWQVYKFFWVNMCIAHGWNKLQRGIRWWWTQDYSVEKHTRKGLEMNLISDQIMYIWCSCSSRKSHVRNLDRSRLHGKYFVPCSLKHKNQETFQSVKMKKIRLPRGKRWQSKACN